MTSTIALIQLPWFHRRRLKIFQRRWTARAEYVQQRSSGESSLGEFERSGISAAQFARQTGLKYSTLAGWLIRYRRSKSQSKGRGLRLEAVVQEDCVYKKSLVLELPGGARMEINDAGQAALAKVLLRILAKSC